MFIELTKEVALIIFILVINIKIACRIKRNTTARESKRVTNTKT